MNSAVNPTVIPNRIYFRIGDVAELLGVKPYVIRFWESEFPFLAPDKATSGQRVYRRPHIESLVLVKQLLHVERYSIEGAKKKLTELRREGKMKETMMKLVTSDSHMFDQVTESVQAQASNESIQIGSKVSKEMLPMSLQANLQEKVSALQALIRAPEELGFDVPGLLIKEQSKSL